MAVDMDAADGAAAADLSCPICLSRLTDPFVTPCGHTFCYACIATHLQHAKNCPSCARFLTAELIAPNFLLSKVPAQHASDWCGAMIVPTRVSLTPSHVAPHRLCLLQLVQQAVKERAQGGTGGTAAAAGAGTGGVALEQVQRAIAECCATGGLGEGDVDALLQLLRGHKQGLQQRQREGGVALLLHFLQASRCGGGGGGRRGVGGQTDGVGFWQRLWLDQMPLPCAPSLHCGWAAGRTRCSGWSSCRNSCAVWTATSKLWRR